MKEANARVVYDSQIASTALRHFATAHDKLTEAEIAMLSLVDPELGEEAQRRKDGQSTVPTPELGDTHPVTMADLDWAMTNLVDPMLCTFRFRIRESAERLDALEARLAVLEGKLDGDAR